MIARDLDGRIYADDEGRALFQELNTQLPNIKADEIGKYEAGVIYTEPGKIAPDPAAVPKSAAEIIENFKNDPSWKENITIEEVPGQIVKGAAAAGGQIVKGAAAAGGKVIGAAIEGATGLSPRVLVLGGLGILALLIIAR